MSPLSLWTRLLVVMRVLALSLNALVIFAVTALVVSVLLALVRGTPVTSVENLYLAVICGLIGYLFVAAFYIKTEIITLPVRDRAAFAGQLKAELQRLGYEVTAEADDHLTFKPSFQSLLIGGGVQAQFEAAAVRIVGPKMYLEKLRYRLRLQSHVGNAQKPFAGPQPLDRRVNAVVISGQVSPAQWQEFHDEVLQVLAKERARITCEVSVLAQSDEGIAQPVIEQTVRDALARLGIQARVRTETGLSRSA